MAAEPVDATNRRAVFVACSVERLRDDLASIDEQAAMVMVEVDGAARQIRGIRRDMFRTPDGQLVPVLTLVGHDVPPGAQRQ